MIVLVVVNFLLTVGMLTAKHGFVIIFMAKYVLEHFPL